MRGIFSFLTVLAVASPLAQAEILEFQLPNIAGGFSYPMYRESVMYTGDSVQVTSVTLHVAAIIGELGSQYCPEAPPLPGYTCPLGVFFDGTVWKNQETNVDYNRDHHEDTQTGDFYLDMGLRPTPGFNELVLGDIIQVGFRFYENIMCCPGLPVTMGPVATLTSVTLSIEVGDEVPIDLTTWGRIKGLYR